MPLNKESLIQRELNYFKSPMAKEPAYLTIQNQKDMGWADSQYEEDIYYLEDKCVYKTPDGRKCAVGALIKPELYDPKWDESDGIGVRGLPDDIQHYLGEKNIDWLSSLQACHDECARSWEQEKEYDGREHFGRYFLEVAKERNLL